MTAKYDHLERRDGEVFLTNAMHEHELPKWKSTRVGDVAYDTNGEVITSHAPAFAAKKEMLDASLAWEAKGFGRHNYHQELEGFNASK